ncbi:MAG TPA: CBS domain-containing protein [Pirellulales bacterium]|nr:CBS domain-containing protein [Pirellulales bacterium]
MERPKVARDIMVTDLVTLDPQMDVFDAIDLLLKHKISGAPVVNAEGKFVGVFTEKDCLRVLVNAAYEQLPTMQIYAFVQTKTQTVSEETDILTIAQIFLSNAFRRLPVVRGDRVVGQISRRDVLSAVSSVKSPHAEHHKARLLYLSSLVALEDAPIS